MVAHRTLALIPHPAAPPKAIEGVDVRWFAREGQLVLRWLVNGAQALVVPPFAGKGRGDELWQTTCGELFLKDREGNGYREFNFSPSQRWAAYRFDGYRAGMADADIPLPEVSGSSGEHIFALTVVLEAAVLGGAAAAGLCAVIEEKDGTKSYWALAHGDGEPDFHDPACFTLPLPAGGGA